MVGKDEKGRFKIGKFWFFILVVAGCTVSLLLVLCLIIAILWLFGAFV